MSKSGLNINLELRLAKHFQRLREEKGLSQESLGLQLQKGQSDIAKIENGKKRITVIELLHWIKALDIQKEQLNFIIDDLYSLIDNKSLWNNK